MSIRDTIERYGADICAGYDSDRYADFAPAEETAGFIDTSGLLDGSRGIAFLCDRLRAKLEERVWQVYYTDITETEIIDSYESPYADELVIKSPRSKLRVADFSLNKRALKALIDEICAQARNMTEETLEQQCAEMTSKAAEYFVQETIENEPLEEIPVIEEIPADTEEGTSLTDTEPEQAADEPNTEPREEPVEIPETNEDFSIDEELSALEGLTHEETMSYLLSSISEINAPAAASDAESVSITAVAPEEVERLAAKKAETVENFVVDIPREIEHEHRAAVKELLPIPPIPQTQDNQSEESAPFIPEISTVHLTIEPQSDDIYIKASRKLREFCEIGKLSREQITLALKENLLSAASAFSDITAAAETIPEGLEPRIAELKEASDNLERYFSLGEDIAERVMFFMMYQMLSYSDRIVETPETKARLNDFFKRYGPSGITLSMLDMRVQ